MSASGDSTWNPAVTEMVAQALRQLGVIAEDETPTGAMVETGLFQLNAIVAAAQATGLHVWTEQEAILFLAPGQVRYELGGPGTNAHTADASAWTLLTLTAAAVTGANALSVASIAGIASGQNIGVVLSDGTTFWTTVNGAPSGTTVPLAASIPSPGAASGSFAFTYTTAIARPLKVPGARLLTLQGQIEMPMRVLSRQEYMDLPNKLSPGVPTQWFYSPQVDRGLLYVWPAPQRSAWAMRFTWYRPLQDFFSVADTIDFPQEWFGPLMWNLARDLMGIYDTPPVRQQYIREMAGLYGDLAISYDRESEPIQFGYDYPAGR